MIHVRIGYSACQHFQSCHFWVRSAPLPLSSCPTISCSSAVHPDLAPARQRRPSALSQPVFTVGAPAHKAIRAVQLVMHPYWEVRFNFLSSCYLFQSCFEDEWTGATIHLSHTLFPFFFGAAVTLDCHLKDRYPLGVLESLSCSNICSTRNQNVLCVTWWENRWQ